MNKMFCIALLTTLYLTVPATSEDLNMNDGKLRHDQTQHETTMHHDGQSEGTKPDTTDNVHGNIDHNAMDHSEPISDRAQASGIGILTIEVGQVPMAALAKVRHHAPQYR